MALAGRDMAAARRCVTELHQHSERVLHCLDEFDRAYPATIGASSAKVSKAA